MVVVTVCSWVCSMRHYSECNALWGFSVDIWTKTSSYCCSWLKVTVFITVYFLTHSVIRIHIRSQKEVISNTQLMWLLSLCNIAKIWGTNQNATHSVAELEFYTWGGQGVAKANSGGPWTMTQNQCITPSWHKKSMNKSYNCWLLHITTH